nr:DUF3105 domain-containing protein [Actinophytocola sp.]
MDTTHTRRGLAAALACLTLLAGCTSETTGVATGEGTADTESAESPPSSGGSSGGGDFTPSEDNEDPSKGIDGIEVVEYPAGKHADPGQRVAYDKSPPFGGAHDQVWAECNGAVYDQPVRNEQMVHALEHGTVWVAYDPEAVEGDDLDALARRVDGEPFLMLSPYPGLDRPISLQSWGHQLKLDDAGDERIDQFIHALRANDYTTPEPGARCDAEGTGFDPSNPPPFEPGPPGPGAMPVDGA